MKFFIDTANIDQIKEVNSWGILSGVTTNPSLVAKEGKDFIDVVSEILTIVDGPVSAEVISKLGKDMVVEAEQLIDKIKERLEKKFNITDDDLEIKVNNIAIKVPMTPEGLKAVKALSEKGIKTNVTLIFSASQALMAASAGASFVSPFLGRLDDIGHDGALGLVKDIVEIFEIYNIPTEIIAASIRSSLHVLYSAKLGADIATVPFAVFEKMLKHPLTDIGIDKFLKDWEKSQNQI